MTASTSSRYLAAIANIDNNKSFETFCLAFDVSLGESFESCLSEFNYGNAYQKMFMKGSKKHGTMAGRGEERGGKAMFTYPLHIAFQSVRNCVLWIIGSEGCMYVKYRSTRCSWTCIGGIATSCSSCNKWATSSLAWGHLRALGRCHTPPITGK